MTTYVPLRQRPIVAVRLKADLMAPKGDWIGIDPDENTIFHLTNEEFNALYGKRDAEPSKPAQSTRRPRKAPKITVYGLDKLTGAPTIPASVVNGRTADSVLSTQLGRVFYHLRRSPKPVTLAQLNEIVDGTENPNSVSAGLSVMGQLELVKRDGSHKTGVWSVTDRGCVVFDRLGPICFTKYNLQVPPDTLPASLAEKLAAAWRDRHNP